MIAHPFALVVGRRLFVVSPVGGGQPHKLSRPIVVVAASELRDHCGQQRGQPLLEVFLLDEDEDSAQLGGQATVTNLTTRLLMKLSAYKHAHTIQTFKYILDCNCTDLWYFRSK